MTAPQAMEGASFFKENSAATPFTPELLELKRDCYFYRFLLDELETCRTDTEREVVVSALLKAQLNIQRLVKKLDLAWAIEA